MISTNAKFIWRNSLCLNRLPVEIMRILFRLSAQAFSSICVVIIHCACAQADRRCQSHSSSEIKNKVNNRLAWLFLSWTMCEFNCRARMEWHHKMYIFITYESLVNAVETGYTDFHASRCTGWWWEDWLKWLKVKQHNTRCTCHNTLTIWPGVMT